MYLYKHEWIKGRENKWKNKNFIKHGIMEEKINEKNQNFIKYGIMEMHSHMEKNLEKYVFGRKQVKMGRSPPSLKAKCWNLQSQILQLSKSY